MFATLVSLSWKLWDILKITSQLIQIPPQRTLYTCCPPPRVCTAPTDWPWSGLLVGACGGHEVQHWREGGGGQPTAMR
jgi:hypothetical protein